MLSNRADDRTESALHLPVNAIIEHVEKDDSLVTHENVLVAEELDQDLLYEVQ